jgi:dihydrofolate reductase
MPMRKLILSVHVTPDGFANHDTSVVGEDWMRFINEDLQKRGALMFGRSTYELFESYWPRLALEKDGDDESVKFAETINGMDKYVFSRTMRKARWENTTIFPTLNKGVIDELKAKEGKDIVVFGGPALISELIMLDTFDEFYMAVQPIIAGSGYRLFSDNHRGRLNLKLVDVHQFSGGVILLHYLPNGDS